MLEIPSYTAVGEHLRKKAVNINSRFRAVSLIKTVSSWEVLSVSSTVIQGNEECCYTVQILWRLTS